MLSRDSIKTELSGLRGECAAFVPASTENIRKKKKKKN